ncbi:hypothetical protein [Methylophaga sp.]|uniref:hypothetical protein n=1 Tax=Methylophaga sp. TaxID=2024840 RepID=UPI002718735E|nr:hypothetical protein [Methylophaga sp.]MDO8826101.1 hypothetical protein [Methylophaga sp.]
MKIFNNIHLNTLYLWVALIAIAFIKMNIYTLTILLVYTGYLPHINALFWLSLSDTGKQIREHLKFWHWTVVISYIVFVYSLYAQSWATALLNSTFPVDPSKFGITGAFLTVLVAPVSLLYYPDYLAGIHTATIVISMFIIPFLGIALLVGFSIKKTLKIIAGIFALTFLMSFFVTLMLNFTMHIKDITRTFALNTDFNSSHLCGDEWANESKSVIFLGGNKVLAYFDGRESGKQFEVVECDHAKIF